MNPETKLETFVRSTGVVLAILIPIALLAWGVWALAWKMIAWIGMGRTIFILAIALVGIILTGVMMWALKK